MALTKANSDVINIPSISVALQSDATAGGIGVMKANLNSPTLTGTPLVPTISSDTLDLSNGSILNVEALNDIFTTKKYSFNTFTRTQTFDYETFGTYPSVTDFFRATTNDLYLAVGQKEVTPTNTVILSYIYYYNVTSSAFEEIQQIETNNVSDINMDITNDGNSIMAVINYIDGADATAGKYTVDSYVYRRDTVNDVWFAGYAKTSKTACVVATTANITLSGTQTIDGVAVVVGNRVLVKNQTTASENGIYVVAAGAWTRATDADTAAELTIGTYTTITSGTVHANDLFIVTEQPTTLGTDPIGITEVCNKIATVGATHSCFFDAVVGVNTFTYLAIVNHKDADTGTASNVKIYQWDETTNRFGSQAVNPTPIQTITLNGAFHVRAFTYSGNTRLFITRNMYSFNGTTTLSSGNSGVVYKWNTSTGLFDTGTTISLVDGSHFDGGQLNTVHTAVISGTTYLYTGANQYGQCELYTYNDTVFTYHSTLNALDTISIHVFVKNNEFFTFMSKNEPSAEGVNTSGFSSILRSQASPVAWRIRSGFRGNILMKTDMFSDTTILDPITGQSTLFFTQHTRSGAQRLGIYKAIYY